MADWTRLFSLPLLFMVYLGECSLDFVEECTLKGFTHNLACSTCELMGDFKLEVIKPDCLQCCQKDKTEEEPTSKKYPFAELVVSFVRGDRLDQFPGLTVKYARGADPVIRLLDENREVQETLGVDKWNTDSLEEFFKLHLQN
ncbi:selenoprotein f [Plakobranchus ocellatus]|uniref:Selenoprotein F n=1 Tax=Plakobranchus ocellatus TaxID=259542 RepID=A0AAV4DNC7_9GAST|nr:selenoprotein f [Plakobranchus ocellatus]